MKLLIASDIHGSASACRKLIEHFKTENADRLVLLGDIMYHGPRNPLPEEYAPMEVARLLNEMKQQILCVRGNCDAEIDRDILEFPASADYTIILTEKLQIFVTHGHVFNEAMLPPLGEGDVLLHGHTHLYALQNMGSHYYMNPGSVSCPKENNAPSYMLFTDGTEDNSTRGRFTLKNMNGSTISYMDI